jgi:hypothetical protein
MSLIPKSTMGSFKDIRQVMKLSQLSFAQSVAESFSKSFSFNDADNILQDFIEQNESVLDDIFHTVSSGKRLKSYCEGVSISIADSVLVFLHPKWGR